MIETPRGIYYRGYKDGYQKALEDVEDFLGFAIGLNLQATISRKMWMRFKESKLKGGKG